MFWYVLSGLLLFLLLLFVVLNLRGALLRVVRYNVVVPRLPRAFDGYRIALISDLHNRIFGDKNKTLAGKILSEDPDLVICAGDMHEFPKSPESYFSLLSMLSAKVPVTHTEGNHDLRNVTPEAYEAFLRRVADSGATVLNDDTFIIMRDGEPLCIYGQSWSSMQNGAQPSFDFSAPSILVCHDPMQFDRLVHLPDLILSGHVHGGLVRLPFLGAIFAPGNGAPLWKRFSFRYLFPKYSRGLYQKGRCTLAVTQGLGFAVLPIRIIPPEIMILTLKSDEKMNNS